jgi:hypothetical protein
MGGRALTGRRISSSGHAGWADVPGFLTKKTKYCIKPLPTANR